MIALLGCAAEKSSLREDLGGLSYLRNHAYELGGNSLLLFYCRYSSPGILLRFFL